VNFFQASLLVAFYAKEYFVPHPSGECNLFHPVPFHIGPKLHSHLKQELFDLLEKIIGLAMLRMAVPR